MKTFNQVKEGDWIYSVVVGKNEFECHPVCHANCSCPVKEQEDKLYVTEIFEVTFPDNLDSLKDFPVARIKRLDYFTESLYLSTEKINNINDFKKLCKSLIK